MGAGPRDYQVVEWHRKISRWEQHGHARNPADGKDVMLIRLNRPAYISGFLAALNEHESSKSPEELQALAAEHFKTMVSNFVSRYRRVQGLNTHPAFPKVLQVHEDPSGEEAFVVTEYVAGKPFLSFTANLDGLQILKLFGTLLEGLGWLHAQGMLHRRIKSENIFGFAENSELKARFATWGLAAPQGDTSPDRGGAAQYIPPEVLFGGAVTAQSDLWAMGSLLYRAVTGKAAFPERAAARNLREMRDIVRHEKIPGEFPDAAALHPERLRELISGLLQPLPEQRSFKTAQSVLDFLKQHWPV